MNNIYIPKKAKTCLFLHTNSLDNQFKHRFYIKSCLFGSLKLTHNSDPEKYKYNGYRLIFDTRSEFSLPDSSMGQNVIIFEPDMSSPVHIKNKEKIS